MLSWLSGILRSERLSCSTIEPHLSMPVATAHFPAIHPELSDIRSILSDYTTLSLARESSLSPDASLRAPCLSVVMATTHCHPHTETKRLPLRPLRPLHTQEGRAGGAAVVSHLTLRTLLLRNHGPGAASRLRNRFLPPSVKDHTIL